MFTKIPNYLLELFMTKNLTHNEVRVLSVVARKTLGYGKEWDRISLSQFVKLTGIDRRNVAKTLCTLVQKSTLAKKDGNGKTPSSWKIIEPSLSELTSVKKYTSVDKVVTKDTPTKESIQKKYIYKLSPLTSNQLAEIGLDLNIPYDSVKIKHETILDKIAAGEFKNTSVYYTLRNWLRGDIEKGYLQKMDETQRMAYKIQYKNFLK